MRYLTVVLLSALLIWFAPHINNSDTAKPHQTSKPHKAAITQTVVKPVQPAKAIVATQQPEPKITQGCDSYRSTFDNYDWNVRTAIAICKAESGGNVYAHSSTGDRGLMQINYVHAAKVDYNLQRLYNPYTNISVAYKVYLSQGWRGWSTYKNKSYLAFM